MKAYKLEGGLQGLRNKMKKKVITIIEVPEMYCPSTQETNIWSFSLSSLRDTILDETSRYHSLTTMYSFIKKEMKELAPKPVNQPKPKGRKINRLRKALSLLPQTNYQDTWGSNNNVKWNPKLSVYDIWAGNIEPFKSGTYDELIEMIKQQNNG